MPRGPAATSSRDAILAAALDLFSSRGYEATTIEDVRDASGASTGSIYHHFGSKQALAAALFVEGLASYQREHLQILARHTDAEAGVRETVRGYLRWVRKNRALARFLLTTREPEVRGASTPAIEELNRRFFAETEAWRQARFAEGALREMPADAYRASVIGPAEWFARRWLAGRTEISLDQAAELLGDAAWRAVRPDPVTPPARG